MELIEEFRVAEKEKLYVVLELVNGGHTNPTPTPIS